MTSELQHEAWYLSLRTERTAVPLMPYLGVMCCEDTVRLLNAVQLRVRRPPPGQETISLHREQIKLRAFIMYQGTVYHAKNPPIGNPPPGFNLK